MKLFVIFLCLIIAAPLAWCNNTILWLTDDTEDLLYLHSNKSNAIGIDTVNLVLNRMQGYEFDVKVASISRIGDQLMNTHNSCTANRVKTEERLQHNLFSLPLNLHPTVRLYFLKDKFRLPSQLDENGNLLSLTELFKLNPDSKIVIVKNISYGNIIDKQVQALDDRYVEVVNVDNRYQTSSKLFFEGFVDFSLDYPNQFTRQLKLFEPKHEYSSLGFSGDPGYLVSYIACSKSATGQAFINQVNGILRGLYKSDDFLNAHLNHLDNSFHSSFMPMFNRVFSAPDEY